MLFHKRILRWSFFLTSNTPVWMNYIYHALKSNLSNRKRWKNSTFLSDLINANFCYIRYRRVFKFRFKDFFENHSHVYKLVQSVVVIKMSRFLYTIIVKLGFDNPKALSKHLTSILFQDSMTKSHKTTYSNAFECKI